MLPVYCMVNGNPMNRPDGHLSSDSDRLLLSTYCGLRALWLRDRLWGSVKSPRTARNTLQRIKRRHLGYGDMYQSRPSYGPVSQRGNPTTSSQGRRLCVPRSLRWTWSFGATDKNPPPRARVQNTDSRVPIDIAAERLSAVFVITHGYYKPM